MNKASLYPSSGPAAMEVSNKVLFMLYGVGVDGVIRESSWRRGYLSGVLKGVQEFGAGGGSRQTTSEGSTRRLPGPEAAAPQMLAMPWRGTEWRAGQGLHCQAQEFGLHGEGSWGQVEGLRQGNDMLK